MNVTAISEFIAKAVMWGVVPLIMLIMLLYAWGITSRTSDSQGRTSAVAGFWAGVVLSIMYIVSQLSAISPPDFVTSIFPGFDLGITLIGITIGFGLLWGVKYIVGTPVVGLITLILSAASCSALYSYFFIDRFRGLVLFLALGAAFGALLNVVVLPRSER